MEEDVKNDIRLLLMGSEIQKYQHTCNVLRAAMERIRKLEEENARLQTALQREARS